ncbi:uncharacterized protein LOC114254294 [Monomorium pharaonis]|uniref:uncharacterized protein LOC114254294 n=1 Tax=Monomorium pharaonis TaxID=307658 RepID=UPI0017472452|nr:uncharacterized protein LOC114254294 [Monomorium pharaonis]
MYAARLSEKNIAIASCVCVWCGVVWCGVVWCGVVWCGVVCEVHRRCLPHCFRIIFAVAFLAASGPLSPLPPSLLQDDRCGPLQTSIQDDDSRKRHPWGDSVFRKRNLAVAAGAATAIGE